MSPQPYKLILLVGILLSCTTALPAQEPNDVEVLARGPVHEGYAEPANQTPQPSPLVPQAPPEAIPELPPEQKPDGDNVQWMPGYWHWDEERNEHIWVSGFWRQPPPDRTWGAGLF